LSELFDLNFWPVELRGALPLCNDCSRLCLAVFSACFLILWLPDTDILLAIAE